MPFGRHKGTPIPDLPRYYLSWLSRQHFVNGELLRHVKAAINGEKPPTEAETIDEIMARTVSSLEAKAGDTSNNNKENNSITGDEI